jgi:hypothetical protein
MLRDYIDPGERVVACPNQDVVYGLGILDFTKEPVVIQVPDFKGRFWVYQIVDERTDSFAKLGKMYDAKPGFYLLAGPGWNGAVPKGITGVFHASTKTGVVIPRVFKESTPEDTQAVQPIISQINMYPLSKFTGQMQTMDWSKNKLVRYSLGTKNKDLQKSPDGSLTIYVSSTPPSQDKMTNWLPSPKGDFSLYIRSYWPEDAILNGTWTPPAVAKVK